MGTSFQGPYIQTLRDQQERGLGGWGAGSGLWQAGGQPRSSAEDEALPCPPRARPTFGNVSPSGSSWPASFLGGEGGVGSQGEGAPPQFSPALGRTGVSTQPRSAHPALVAASTLGNR